MAEDNDHTFLEMRKSKGGNVDDRGLWDIQGLRWNSTLI